MARLRILLPSALALLLLAACGNKGPLTQPDRPEPAEAAPGPG